MQTLQTEGFTDNVERVNRLGDFRGTPAPVVGGFKGLKDTWRAEAEGIYRHLRSISN